jgi:lipoprotein-anchoring transpeptidase ErfK/SrfK
MSIQRLVLAVFVTGVIGTAPAFAQNSPLDLDRVTRVSSRNVATAQPVAAARTRMSERYEENLQPPRVGFLEMLFGGISQATAPQYQYDPFEQSARGNAYYRQQEANLETEPQERRPTDPKFMPQTVAYNGPEKPGTIIVDTPARFLYLVLEDGRAMRYGIGVGRAGFTWSGMAQISAKREWPDWIPPDEMLARRPDLPHFMAGGPENPLGARAMYLGSTLYRIHGSNEPWTIGTAVSSGCIRMRNQDVISLYERVKIGTKVVVL